MLIEKSISLVSTSRQGVGDVRLKDVTVRYGARPVLDCVSLDVQSGEFVCLLGPSGCGKTTTLRAIAGLVSVEGGEIYINGKMVNHVPTHRRGTAMVFQDLALFPHMTVVENIAFGLRLRKIDKNVARSRVSEMIGLLRLNGLENRFPKQLSGGQQQRVALARGLVVNPAVVLLDEPFASLDRKLREEMRREIRTLQRRLKITALFVTHDQEEALTMADTVVVMNQGRVEQIGTSTEIYESPASRFVQSFVGTSNFLRITNVTPSGNGLSCRLAGYEILVKSRPIGDANVDSQPEIAIRPERLRMLSGDTDVSLPNRVPGTIRDVIYEGAVITYEVVLPDGQPVLVRMQKQGQPDESIEVPQFNSGKSVMLAWGGYDASIMGG